MVRTVVLKRSTLRQLVLFFSFLYLFTYVYSSWINITSTYFCLLGVYFFMSVTSEELTDSESIKSEDTAVLHLNIMATSSAPVIYKMLIPAFKVSDTL